MAQNDMMSFADGWSADDTEATRADFIEMCGRQNGKQHKTDERRAAIVGEPAWTPTGVVNEPGITAAAHARHATIVPGEPKHGQTTAWVRTGITDRQAARLDPSPHSDAYDADDYNRPRNGLGTYHESDASW